ncbi:MAG: competence/damage-inducible protein A [Planctomycetota bacterium]|nr:MAG: competence/damage-inducible protein A [Planctomycetota bacterium]
MKKASIITIGNEVLSGQTLDTNVAYLGRRLHSIGIPVVSCYAVGDEVDLIVRGLDLASRDASLVLVTGGLGPTGDDLTRQACAKFLGVELQLQDELLQKIRDFFTLRDMQMPETNRVQACIPAGATALENKIGTAPGFMACKNEKLFFVMPGVPVEMKQMFEQSVLAKLSEFAGEQVVVVRKLKCFGTGESKIAELLGDLCQRGRNPLINCTVRAGVITLDIIATAGDQAKAEAMAEKDEKLLYKLLGELVYGRGEQTLAEVVGEKLAEQGKTIAVAESCTGGCLAKLLTNVPGASRYFKQGWVTYSNSSKSEELGVPVDLIEKHGAVTEQVAESMARGAKKNAGTDFAVGITGIAGPTGGSEQKPVGLVYISLGSDNGCETRRFVISGDRELIRLRAAQTALNMLRLELEV